MSRAIDGSKRKNRRKKILKMAKGFWGRRRTNFKAAKDAVTKSLAYAYRDRRDRKGDFRRLWIIRINAACREEGISYSRLIAGLDKAGIIINRKALAWLATEDNAAFKAIAEKAKAATGA
jgi:large subunit ribosomal protein L20